MKWHVMIKWFYEYMKWHATMYTLGFIVGNVNTVASEECNTGDSKILLRLSLESGRTLRKTYSTRNYEGSFSIGLSTC